MFEQWSKLVSVSSGISTTDSETSSNSGDPKIYKSASDAIIFLDTSSEECIRRS